MLLNSVPAFILKGILGGCKYMYIIASLTLVNTSIIFAVLQEIYPMKYARIFNFIKMELSITEKLNYLVLVFSNFCIEKV